MATATTTNTTYTMSSNNSSSISSFSAAVLEQEGLILETVLSFALDNLKDVYCFLRVNHHWKLTTLKLYPPIVLHANKLIRLGGSDNETMMARRQRFTASLNWHAKKKFLLQPKNDRHISWKVGQNVVEQILLELKQKDSSLYLEPTIKKKKKKQSAFAFVPPVPKWPDMNLRHSTSLYTFVYHVLTQKEYGSPRDPDGAEAKFAFYRDIVLRHMEALARETVRTMAGTIHHYCQLVSFHAESLPVSALQSAICKVLTCLLQQWNAWVGITKHYTNITLYTFRSDAASSPKKIAQQKFVEALASELRLWIDAESEDEHEHDGKDDNHGSASSAGNCTDTTQSILQIFKHLAMIQRQRRTTPNVLHAFRDNDGGEEYEDDSTSSSSSLFDRLVFQFLTTTPQKPLPWTQQHYEHPHFRLLQDKYYEIQELYQDVLQKYH